MEASEVNQLRDTFEKIVGCIQEGKPAEAEALAQHILEDYPEDPNILRVLGVALMRQGKFNEALDHLSSSVEIAPDLAGGHEQYGLALAAAGRFDEAEESLLKASALDPNSTTVHSKLARLHAMQGKGEESQQSQGRMLELTPHRQKLQDAMRFQVDGKLDEAREIVKSVLREFPDDVDALHQMGSIRLAQDAHSDAEAFFRRTVQIAPDLAVGWNGLAAALKKQGKLEQAVDAIEKALSLEPDNAERHSFLGILLLVWGKEDRALEAFDAALAIQPDLASALHSRGHTLKTMGRQDEAIRSYRLAARARPDLGEVFWSLANLKTFRFEPHEVDFMRSQLDEAELTDESRVHFHYALAKHFEDKEEYPEAFQHYAQGGDIKRMSVSYDPVEFDAQTDQIIEAFTPEFFEERSSFGHSDASPILIVGLPRSGSTLIEQILASHSQVDGTAELSDLMTLASQTGQNRFDRLRYPDSLMDMDAGSIEDIGKDYIERTYHHREGAPYFCDKMPNNFPHIGFLHLILPNAKVIDARRHPLDSCFGTFKQLFAKGQTFSYDLFDLGQYYINYIRLMEHWDRVLPGKVLRVNYEDNVADLETQVRRMIEHCGLEWEDQVVRFYESDRSVKTASSEQVRQPIYSKSVNSWKRYETELADLIVVLKEVLEKLPDHIERPKIPSQ